MTGQFYRPKLVHPRFLGLKLPTDVQVDGGLTISLLPNIAGDVPVGHFVARIPTAVKADASNALHAGKVVGVSLGDGRCATSGEAAFEDWVMTPGVPAFLGDDGFPTSVVPTSGVLMQVGLAITATRLSIVLGLAFTL